MGGKNFGVDFDITWILQCASTEGVHSSRGYHKFEHLWHQWMVDIPLGLAIHSFDFPDILKTDESMIHLLPSPISQVTMTITGYCYCLKYKSYINGESIVQLKLRKYCKNNLGVNIQFSKSPHSYPPTLILCRVLLGVSPGVVSSSDGVHRSKRFRPR